MSSNLNWLGNKGLDPNMSQQERSPFAIPYDTRGSIYVDDPLLMTQSPLAGRGLNVTPQTPSTPQQTHSTPQQAPSTPQQRTTPMQQTPPATQTPHMHQTPSTTQAPPTVTQEMPIMDVQGPPPATEEGFIPAFLRRNIGKNVRAEFIVGSSQYTDRVGRLIEVGISYFVLEDVNSRTHIMCDLYSVKFVTVLQS